MATRRTAKKPTTVALVGAGTGDTGLLTLRAAEVLAAAQTVVHDDRVPPSVVALATSADEVLLADHEAAAVCVSAARAGRNVVRLYAGDPFLHDSGRADALALVKAKVPFELVPGIPAAVAVPGYAGIPVGLPRTVAHLDSDVADTTDWAGLAGTPGTLVLTCNAGEVGKAAAGLTEHGRRGDTPVAVTASGTTTAQRTIVSTLDTVEQDVAAAVPSLPSPVVVTVGAAVADRAKLSWYETQPLFGWRVLVPRTREQSATTVQALRDLGGDPLEVPTIAVEPPRTPAPMERAVRGLVTGRYQWVAFTSTNAVRAVQEKLDDVGLDARAFAGVKVAAIGTATAEALQALGIRPDLVPSGQQSSEGLLADWPEYDDVLDPLDRVFLPRADIATETLVAGLKERGWAVDDVTAYRTVRAAPPAAPIREALKTGGVDAVLFTSSSTVRNLLGIAGKPHDTTVIACIGPATAETAKELGLRVDVLAEEATIPSLIAGLAEFAVSKAAERAALAATPIRGRRRR
jgi:uroporphyrinogen III methyltransferase/synthase